MVLPTTTEMWMPSTENGTNMTEAPTFNSELYTAYNVMVSVTTAFIMLSMGTGVSWEVVKPHLKRPIAPIIGLVCQLVILPCVAFGFAIAFGFDDETSIGMIIMASSPGGAVSNIFSFWSRGDLGLSVTMTTISTTLALGFFPLNMFIYTRRFTDEDTQIPFLSMFITVLYTWCAAVIGVFVGYKWPQIRPYTTRFGSVLGMVLIISCGLIQSQLYESQFTIDWQLWFSGFIMPFIGYSLGNIFGLIFCLKMKQNRTIGFETGMQNAGVALTSIALSYDESEAYKYVQFPILYSTWMIVIGFGIVILHWIYFCVKERKTICQKNQDKKSKNLAQIGDDDASSIASESSHGVPQFVQRIKPVDMGKGTYTQKISDDHESMDMDGVISVINIGVGNGLSEKDMKAANLQTTSVEEKVDLMLRDSATYEQIDADKLEQQTPVNTDGVYENALVVVGGEEGHI